MDLVAVTQETERAHYLLQEQFGDCTALQEGEETDFLADSQQLVLEEGDHAHAIGYFLLQSLVLLRPEMKKLTLPDLLVTHHLLEESLGGVPFSVQSVQSKDEKVYQHHHLFLVPNYQADIFLVLDTNGETVPGVEGHLLGQFTYRSQTDVLAQDPEAGSHRTVDELFDVVNSAALSRFAVNQLVEQFVCNCSVRVGE